MAHPSPNKRLLQEFLPLPANHGVTEAVEQGGLFLLIRFANEYSSKSPQQRPRPLPNFEIGIGGRLTTPPLPHHRTYGSVYGGSVNYAVCWARGKEDRV